MSWPCNFCLLEDKKFMVDLGITKEEFHAITWFTSWAVDADHGSDLSVDSRLLLQSLYAAEILYAEI